MAARRVICPGCQTTLQLPESSAALKVKCPKCAKVLAIAAPQSPAATQRPAPAATQRPAPAAAPRPAPAASPRPTAPSQPVASTRPVASKPAAPQQPIAPAGSFFDLSDLPAPSSSNRSPAGGFPLGPSPASSYQLPKSQQPQKAKAAKQGGSGGSSIILKVFMILGAIAGVGVLLCAGLLGLAATGVIGVRHSGWEQATLQGVSIKMPKAGKVTTKTTPAAGSTIYEITTQRRESGSQYILVVAKFTAAELQALSIQEIIEIQQIVLSNRRSVTRDGVTGLAGTVASIPDTSLLGADVELFADQGTMVIVAYLPYSIIKDRVGGKMTPRRNEPDLDKPDEYFESLGFM